MANTAAPCLRRRSVPMRPSRVVSPPQPRALRQVASFRYPAHRQSTRHAPYRARRRPERESVQQARVLGRTAGATRVGAFGFRSGFTPPSKALTHLMLFSADGRPRTTLLGLFENASVLGSAGDRREMAETTGISTRGRMCVSPGPSSPATIFREVQLSASRRSARARRRAAPALPTPHPRTRALTTRRNARRPCDPGAQHCGTVGLKLANIPAGLSSNSQMWNIHTPNPSLRVNGMPKNTGGSALCHFS